MSDPVTWLRQARQLAWIVVVAATAAQAASPPPEKVEHGATIELAEHVKEGEELLVQAMNGSIELRGDPNAVAIRVEAHLEVDGDDEKDVRRRAQLVRLYAERVPDGAVVVDALFPGKPMPRDRARIVVVTPNLAKATLRTTTGTIDVRSTQGHLRASSASGGIVIRDHAGPVDAKTTSGPIVVARAAGEVRATSGSGAIEVRLSDDNDLPGRIESKSGSVLFEAGSGFDGVVEAITTSGAFVIDDPGARARVPTLGPHRARVEVGAAVVHFEIQTTSGSIRIRVPDGASPGGSAPARRAD